MDTLRDTDPRKVGNWSIAARIGSGGMGTVYLGVSKTGVTAAVKVLHEGYSDNPVLRERLSREAETLSSLDSPHIAKLIDSDVSSKIPWIATEYIAGPSLDQFIASNGPLDAASWETLAVALASALQVSHQKGIVHRDIKPENIVLSPTGPMLIDFGIAKIIEQTGLTTTDTNLGTPAWLSPEQIETANVTFSSDMFSMGSVLAFAGSGTPPFGWGPSQAVIFRITNNKANLEGLSDSQRNLVQGIHEVDPQSRHSASEFLDQLVSLGIDPSEEKLRSQWLENVYPKISEKVVSERLDTSENTSMESAALGKKRKRLRKRASYAAALGTVGALLFSFTEIGSDLSSFLPGQDSQTGVSSNFFSIAERTVENTPFANDCYLIRVELAGEDANLDTGEGVKAISEARWLLQPAAGKTVLNFRCYPVGPPLNLTMVYDASPGKSEVMEVNLSGRTDRAAEFFLEFQNVSSDPDVTDVSYVLDPTCSANPIRLKATANESGYFDTGWETTPVVRQNLSTKCLLVPYYMNVLDSELATEYDSKDILNIERIISESAPEDCSYLGITSRDYANENSGDLWLAAQQDFLGFHSNEFDMDTVPGIQVDHEPAMFITLNFRHTFSYICGERETLLEVSDSYVEGLDLKIAPNDVAYVSGFTPTDDEVEIDAEVEITWYTKSGEKCNTTPMNLKTDVEGLAYSAPSETIDRARCPIPVLSKMVR